MMRRGAPVPPLAFYSQIMAEACAVAAVTGTPSADIMTLLGAPAPDRDDYSDPGRQVSDWIDDTIIQALGENGEKPQEERLEPQRVIRRTVARLLTDLMLSTPIDD